MSAPHAAPPIDGGIYRIHWVPGTDRLLAVCFCGEKREFDDPVELWDWLLAHPAHPARPEHPVHPAHPVHPEHPAYTVGSVHPERRS